MRQFRPMEIHSDGSRFISPPEAPPKIVYLLAVDFNFMPGFRFRYRCEP
ncbi:MAG: hypothetical protein KDA36_04590 [Planctomycetaceae bacterium]|nr:hypothetical protein [Planctomycetaceae bacterium]